MTDEIVIGGDMADIPAGTYPATCKAITVKHSPKYDNEFRAWDFELANGSVVGGSTSMATGGRSKGGKWIAALLGRKPEQGEKVSVIGRPCLVTVVEGEDGWPKVDAVAPPLQAPAAIAPDAPERAAAPSAPAATPIAPLP